MSEVQFEDKSRDYRSPDGLVEVEGIQSGKVAYNAKSKTLTLKRVKASRIHIMRKGTLKLRLKGKSKVTRIDDSGESMVNYGSLTISGRGVLRGNVNIGGKFTMKSGTFKFRMLPGQLIGLSCGDFCMKGGAVSQYGGSGLVSCGGDFVVKKGTFKIKNGSIWCGNFKVKKRGSVCVKQSASNPSGSIHCDSFRLKGGVVKVKTPRSNCIQCDSATIDGGTLLLLSHTDIDSSTHLGSSLQCNDFTLSKGSVSALDMRCTKLSVSGGSLSLSGKDSYGLSCEKMSIKGGSVVTKLDNEGGIASLNLSSLNMKGGAIDVQVSKPGFTLLAMSIKRATVSGGSITANEGIEFRKLVMSGGSINVRGQEQEPSSLRIRKNTTISGGDINVEHGDIYVDKSLAVKGGHIDVEHGQIRVEGSLDVAGGRIDVSGDGIFVGKDLTISSGVVSVRGFTDGIPAIWSNGAVTITGGSITAESACLDPGFAISANRISNLASSLVSIRGWLSEGATFAAGGNEYFVIGPYDSGMGVKLIKRGSQGTPTPASVVFGEMEYPVLSEGGVVRGAPLVKS